MKITEEIFNALAPKDLGKSMPSEMPLPPCDPILRTLPSLAKTLLLQKTVRDLAKSIWRNSLTVRDSMT